FVAQNREQNGRTFVAEFLPPRLCKNSCASRIMRAVDDDARIPDLKACRPFDRCETTGDFVIRDWNGHRLQRGNRDRGVHLLMFAMQHDFRFRPRVVNELQRGVTFFSALSDDCFRLRSLRRRDNGSAWLNDSCFFLRNLDNGMAEPFLVVEIDWSNDADRRLDRISGIESSAQAGFEHQNFAARPLKMLQRQCRRDLKKRRMWIPIANAFTNFSETTRDFVFGNLLAVHANAFAKADKVRGGEQSSAVIGSTSDRIDHRADGSLTISAGDVNDLAASAPQLEGGASRRRRFAIAPRHR